MDSCCWEKFNNLSWKIQIELQHFIDCCFHLLRCNYCMCCFPLGRWLDREGNGKPKLCLSQGTQLEISKRSAGVNVLRLIHPFPSFLGCICFPPDRRWNSRSHRGGEDHLPCVMFMNKVGGVWFTPYQTSKMTRLLRCSGTAHPIRLSAGHTGPPQTSAWTGSSFRLLSKEILSLDPVFLFWKPGPAAPVPPSDMQQLCTQTLGLCAFHTAQREVMDWFVSLSRSLTSDLDAVRPAPEG